MNTLAAVMASALILSASGNARAHGDHDPKHGGTVGRGNDDVVIEFVVEKESVAVYIEDEQGKPISTRGISGTLILVAPQRPRQEVALVSAGGNKLRAQGMKPVRGDRLRARITLPDGAEVESLALYSK